PTPTWSILAAVGIDGREVARRHFAQPVVVVVQRQPNLAQVVLALDTGCRLANLLHGGQQKAHQRADDGDDDEQFNERKTMASSHGCQSFPKKRGCTGCAARNRPRTPREALVNTTVASVGLAARRRI